MRENSAARIHSISSFCEIDSEKTLLKRPSKRRRTKPASMLLMSKRCESFVRCVEVLVQNLCHSKHMNLVLLEDRAHWFIADDLAFVTRILKIIGLDVSPQSLHRLRSRELYS